MKTATRTVLISVCLVLTIDSANANPSGPVMRLFPTTVLEDIRETGKVAEEMENSIQDVIARLDLQQQLYNESRCEGADEDQGCERIARQLGVTYLEMLEMMTKRLPDMENAVNSTRTSLEKRLREELGLKSTPTALQNVLLGSASSAEPVRETIPLRGGSGIRLSDRFKRYYDLVATSRVSGSQSLAVVAADIYLDMDEAARLIAATQEEISRAALMEQLNQSFGMITEEMSEVVSGVKKILFGESAAETRIAALPRSATDLPYVSPLEM